MECVTEYVCGGVCDGVCDGRRLSQRLSQAEGVTEVWLFGKDSFEECPLTVPLALLCSCSGLTPVTDSYSGPSRTFVHVPP